MSLVFRESYMDNGILKYFFSPVKKHEMFTMGDSAVFVISDADGNAFAKFSGLQLTKSINIGLIVDKISRSTRLNKTVDGLTVDDTYMRPNEYDTFPENNSNVAITLGFWNEDGSPIQYWEKLEEDLPVQPFSSVYILYKYNAGQSYCRHEMRLINTLKRLNSKGVFEFADRYLPENFPVEEYMKSVCNMNTLLWQQEVDEIKLDNPELHILDERDLGYAIPGLDIEASIDDPPYGHQQPPIEHLTPFSLIGTNYVQKEVTESDPDTIINKYIYGAMFNLDPWVSRFHRLTECEI